MKTQLAASFILITFPIFLVSCVSSLLKESPPTFSKDVKWSAPQAPFQQIDSSSIYPSWKNKVTGNVISIISDCGEASAAQSLSAFHLLIENSLEDLNVIKEEKITFQNSAALVHFSKGELDGQPIEVQSMSFKRKNCGYVTALSGKKSNLDADRKKFEQFNGSLSFE